MRGKKGDAEGSNRQSREGKERRQGFSRGSQQWVRVVCHLAEAPVESWDTQPHCFVEFGVCSCL